MITNMSGGESGKLTGFIHAELYNPKDNTRRTLEGHNFVTKGGLQLMLDSIIGSLLETGADSFGSPYCSQYVAKQGNTEGGTSFAGNQGNSNKSLTNVLLNLGTTEISSITNNTNYVNMYDNDLLTASKVVGYANNNINPIGDGKEGALDNCKPAYVADRYTVAKTWKYDAGVAVGTINAIGMAPAPVVKTNNGDGFQFAKCLDKTNQQYANYLAMSTGFLPPGIIGFTSNDEILLNYSQDGKTKHKYTISTGVITDLADTDPFFVIPNNACDCVLIGNYMYVLDSVNPLSNSSSPRVTVYDVTANMAQKAQFTCSYLTSSDNMISAKFLLKDGNLYVTAIDRIVKAGASKLWTLSKGSNDWYSSAGTAATDFSSIGAVIPTGLDKSYVCFGNYGGNYVMYVFSRLDGIIDFQLTGYKMIGFVFTDFTNIVGSLVDIICGVTPNSIAFNAGSNKGLLRIGYNYYCNSTYFGTAYGRVSGKKVVTNNSTQKQIDNYNSGVYLSMDKDWSNIFSLKVLSSPLVKGPDDILYVTYGYKISQA